MQNKRFFTKQKLLVALQFLFFLTVAVKGIIILEELGSYEEKGDFRYNDNK